MLIQNLEDKSIKRAPALAICKIEKRSCPILILDEKMQKTL
jgi:hypothetical protein